MRKVDICEEMGGWEKMRKKKLNKEKKSKGHKWVGVR